ncbi:unnamed protein product [Protopolystoma xenopodis]|uniref:Uncharacterized protein n=1 Tax=Protopolystoma xenopodis TaxID=117903 RepID=A0A448WVX2_9PLAT|nr:unnamed protein product [Protopolystoma xenopodis]
MGVYTSLFERISQSGAPPTFLQKGACGLAAGVIGSFTGTPTEVCLIRMTSDGR